MRAEFNKNVYNKQRNYSLSLLKKTKIAYYTNLDEKDILDNRQFWKTVKPMPSDKIKSYDKITLIGEEKDNENFKVTFYEFCERSQNSRISGY